jgi:hypothetical protein
MTEITGPGSAELLVALRLPRPLQQSVADMTARLKKDLGLGGPDQSPKGT